MDTVRITEHMADALINAAPVGGRWELAHAAGPATKRGLARRQLVVPGSPWKLTTAGHYVRGYLLAGGTRRSFSPVEWTPEAQEKIPADDAPQLSRIPREWKAVDPDTTTLGKPVDDFQVKIWYAEASEVVSHIDFLNAGTIYSEAVTNPRVVAAEVHCPGGCLAASFRRVPLDSTQERG